ncbi:MAG: hypothetical protein KGP13_03695 [Burkholderiales bacterium]|jgi:hypothetical protein|nr:hypothetical protein [Burkholderiales bacterium]
MHKLLSTLLATVTLSFVVSAQTVTPSATSAQTVAKTAPLLANTDKAASPEPSKANKKSKKKKLKKKKARRAKGQ